jgi:hypothetical protein
MKTVAILIIIKLSIIYIVKVLLMIHEHNKQIKAMEKAFGGK